MTNWNHIYRKKLTIIYKPWKTHENSLFKKKNASKRLAVSPPQGSPPPSGGHTGRCQHQRAPQSRLCGVRTLGAFGESVWFRLEFGFFKGLDVCFFCLVFLDVCFIWGKNIVFFSGWLVGFGFVYRLCLGFFQLVGRALRFVFGCF